LRAICAAPVPAVCGRENYQTPVRVTGQGFFHFGRRGAWWCLDGDPLGHGGFDKRQKEKLLISKTTKTKSFCPGGRVRFACPEAAGPGGCVLWFKKSAD
jgi:hypothetical protein